MINTLLENPSLNDNITNTVEKFFNMPLHDLIEYKFSNYDEIVNALVYFFKEIYKLYYNYDQSVHIKLSNVVKLLFFSIISSVKHKPELIKAVEDFIENIDHIQNDNEIDLFLNLDNIRIYLIYLLYHVFYPIDRKKAVYYIAKILQNLRFHSFQENENFYVGYIINILEKILEYISENDINLFEKIFNRLKRMLEDRSSSENRCINIFTINCISKLYQVDQEKFEHFLAEIGRIITKKSFFSLIDEDKIYYVPQFKSLCKNINFLQTLVHLGSFLSKMNENEQLYNMIASLEEYLPKFLDLLKQADTEIKEYYKLTSFGKFILYLAENLQTKKLYKSNTLAKFCFEYAEIIPYLNQERAILLYKKIEKTYASCQFLSNNSVVPFLMKNKEIFAKELKKLIEIFVSSYYEKRLVNFKNIKIYISEDIINELTDEELFHLTILSVYKNKTHKNQKEIRYLPCTFYFNKQTLETIKNRLLPLLISGSEYKKEKIIEFFKAHNYEITNPPKIEITNNKALSINDFKQNSLFNLIQFSM